MKIALIGFGKMGKTIEKMAIEKGHEISAICDKSTIDENGINKADVCIEFTSPEAVLSNVKILSSLKKNIVIGTTGWYEHLEEVKKIAKDHDIGILYSPNFSLGVQLFAKIVHYASQLINVFDDYDIAGIEYHHSEKKDTPSGTAKMLSSLVEKQIDRVNELNFSSVRCGNIPGTHTILFDSDADTIALTHTARNREGFAKGAVQAAEWLQGKKGFFTFEDCINDLIK